MLRTFFLPFVGFLAVHSVHAKAVFAHFMVYNARNYTLDDWETEIGVAIDAHINAFALNIAYDKDDGDMVSLDTAFVAAEEKNFKLFLSFDYAGNGPWPLNIVSDYIRLYSESPAYYRYGGGPFVSTFEGPDSATDWQTIKANTGCFLVPDWSSRGAKPAIELADGVADALFSWAAWPWGPQDMDTYIDASYLQFLNGRPYMMAVSPWFYTNLPGYNKNWLWKGDNLWFDRWNEILFVQPEWVEIISWNDWGESHYIGPLRNDGIKDVMTKGRAPYDFVTGMPHDGWRDQLPYLIDLYVNNVSTFTRETITYWYRLNPAAACGDGSTTANTASQLQIEFPPSQVMEDRVYYNALLNSNAQVLVSFGGNTLIGTWTQTPDGGVGVYHGSVPFNGHTGPVTVHVVRSGNTVMAGTGQVITTDCSTSAGLTNWNAWVGSAESSATVTGTSDKLDDKVCVNGTGAYNFAGLCDFACQYGYCPIGACLCRELGTQKKLPPATGPQGYPAAGLDASYSGLCSFDCLYGYCPEEACATVSSPLTVPTVSDFLPPACVAGTGTGNWGGLCSYACNYGMCPTQLCTCTRQGTLVVAPPIIRDTTGYPVGVENDWGLCEFTCPRGYCPAGACNQKPRSGTGDPVYIDPIIWGSDTPAVPTLGCDAPCLIVPPPFTLSTPTTIQCLPLTETLSESWTIGSSASVTVSTITFQDITTTLMPVYNINITEGNVNGVTYSITPSVFCTATITAINPNCASDASTSCSQAYIISTSPTPTITIPVGSKSQVYFTSTSTPTPTCTRAGGCGGKVCHGDSCNDCNGSGCSCGSCCNGCGGQSGGGGGGGGAHLPKGCIGLACPPGLSPPRGGGGSSGSPGDGSGDPDEDCTSKTTVTDTTVYCTMSASAGAQTMGTTCTTTQYDTTTGCSMTAIKTTKYSSEGCPTLPPFVPPTTNADGFLPLAASSDPHGYVFNTGTFTWEEMSGSPTSPGGGAKPTPIAITNGDAPSFTVTTWQENKLISSNPDVWKTYYSYKGYADDTNADCVSPPSYVYTTENAMSASIPDSIDGMEVYGDSCSFSRSDMKLHCDKYADATCLDATVSAYTCEWTDTLHQSVWTLLRCKWA